MVKLPKKEEFVEKCVKLDLDVISDAIIQAAAASPGLGAVTPVIMTKAFKALMQGETFEEVEPQLKHIYCESLYPLLEIMKDEDVEKLPRVKHLLENLR